VNIPNCYLSPPLPKGLEGLTELVLDLRWSWNHAADRLWELIDPEIWRRTGNPWLILQHTTAKRFKTLSSDAEFVKLIKSYSEAHHKSLEAPTWFGQSYPKRSPRIAYFSMEYGLGEAIPIYAGGLGILAGDYLKTASDLGVPVTGVGLLYQQGYFRQVIDDQGNQTEFYPHNDPSQLPIIPVRDQAGEWLRVELDFPGRKLSLRTWEATVGRVKLYLLDSNDPLNIPSDRGITGELYGGGPEMRLQQEIILGIGGWRLLTALGINPEICHLNEGHAALAVLERARSYIVSSGQQFNVALAATRAGNIFTTHTPVEAGFDRFAPGLINRYLSSYATNLGLNMDGLLALGRQDAASSQEPLNMALLAVRGSGVVNAVSRLHQDVSRRIFQPLFPRWPEVEVPVTHVTNGVHVPSWDSSAADETWTNACGKERWLNTMDSIEDDLKKLPDEELWKLRTVQREQLIHFVRDRVAWQLASTGKSSSEISKFIDMLDPNILTLGFARRFTDYKRPNLLLHDPERLSRMLNNVDRPVQIIIAGKAHPRDGDGKAMLKEWWQYSSHADIHRRVIFLADYDMSLASYMVQGVDLWINTPRRPWEACGTSGMKVLVNGGLNISERDGWWAEAYHPGVGWVIGDGQEHGNDPDWDRQEADQLYYLLENEIIPCFYERNNRGIPVKWTARMRTSMAELTPHFSTNRMVREYVDRLYGPAAKEYGRRIAGGAVRAGNLCKWKDLLDAYWGKLRISELDVRNDDDNYIITVSVYLDEIPAADVEVQLYADPEAGTEPEIYTMEKVEPITGAVNSYRYKARISALRNAGDYTARIIPYFNGASVPLEAGHILWYER